MEVLAQDLDQQPEMSREVAKMYVKSLLAGMTEFANFLRYLEDDNSANPSEPRIISEP